MPDKQRLLILGDQGNMGRRYAAICDAFYKDEVEVLGCDLGEDWPREFDKVVVATPTETHTEICKAMTMLGKPFLCEKPISKDALDVDLLRNIASGADFIHGYMVNNWAFVFPGLVLKPESNDVKYDFYSTGKDGKEWDCIQLYYLAKDYVINNQSPIFSASINGVEVTREMIDQSYVRMLGAFIRDEWESLWGFDSALEAHRKVRGMLDYSYERSNTAEFSQGLK